MKILDISGTAQGAYRLLRTRVKKINEKGLSNVIVCPNGEWVAKMREIGLDIVEWNIQRNVNIAGLFKEIRNMQNIIARLNPDIVHTHNSKAGALGRIGISLLNFFRLKNIFIIHQVHGFHFTHQKSLKRIFFICVEFILSKMCDRLLFQNQYEYNLAKKYRFKRKAKLIYIGNGIDFKEFPMNIIHDDKHLFNIICIARIEKIKNHLMLVKALGILKEKYKINDFRCYLIGEGNLDNQSLSIINTMNLSDNIILTGALDRNELVDKLGQANLSVLTSFKEGKPRSIMESLYMGIPCIGTNVIGTNELISDSETGFLVPLDNGEMLAEKINLLYCNSVLYKKLSMNAHQYAKENFNEDQIIDRLISIYKTANFQK